MSSANEEMHHPQPPHHQQQPQQKPRVSPLEFRNTDLVSRLLAATPPYLYNMPLVPHTYFFSEMLRSFVQAKTGGGEAASSPQRNPSCSILPPRRTRKRSWTNVSYQHKAKLEAAKEMPPPPLAAASPWPPKMYADKHFFDKPLELTMSKKEESGEPTNKLLSFATPQAQSGGGDLPPNPPSADQMVLPPPPPLWYPPLYPPSGSYPSTFDPLHFFIDLRVSGHIYDRKGALSKDETVKEDNVQNSPLGYFKQSRHCSAFSVPGGQSTAACAAFPINLTNTGNNAGDVKMKFDVKSMGFDKLDASNKTSTNYIMQNIDGIYKNINGSSSMAGVVAAAAGGGGGGCAAKHEVECCKELVDGDEEDDEDKKKSKDLRALIGLELVVDYMSSRKKNHPAQIGNECAAKEVEDECTPSRNSSPAVEVVAVSENDGFVYN